MTVDTDAAIPQTKVLGLHVRNFTPVETIPRYLTFLSPRGVPSERKSLPIETAMQEVFRECFANAPTEAIGYGELVEKAPALAERLGHALIITNQKGGDPEFADYYDFGPFLPSGRRFDKELVLIVREFFPDDPEDEKGMEFLKRVNLHLEERERFALSAEDLTMCQEIEKRVEERMGFHVTREEILERALHKELLPSLQDKLISAIEQGIYA